MPDMRQPEAGSADACAHVLFERHADTHPDAPAVEHDDGRLTYRELDALGNRLAHHLRNLGIGPGDRVGICVERSPDFVTGVLGTLKAGGIYVPLDPEYPVARLSSMAADAGVDVLLLQERTLGRVADAGAREVVLDRERDRLAALPDTRLPCRADVDGPAYVTYTSGSTGRPKGVMPSHRSIIRLVRDTNYISLGPGDRVAQASSCTFDPITFEVWGALLNGACLAIVPRAAMFDADELAAALRRLRVTSMFLTTAAFYAMLRKRPDAFASLRDLLIGGEALETRWVKEILAAGPPRRLVNVYGPTETTTFATWFEVGAAPEGEATLPIGHAVTGAELLVLGEGMAEVPPGGEGELYIGGAGLAIGYHGRPALTAACFVPHPSGRYAGERLYRTGDLVRVRPGGAVDFVRRLDNQVKIRGFRVELGEIEMALKEHPALVDAAVTAIEEGEDRRLVAFVVPRHADPPTAPDVRAHLHRRLPEYMVPAEFSALAALPLNTNGKVDRAALATMRNAGGRLAEPSAAAGSPVEDVLAELWAGLLGLDRVGIDDDFFALGGDSLTATRVLARVNEALDVDLPLGALMSGPNVRELAAQVTAARSGGRAASGAPPAPRTRRPPLPLSYTQQRFWFMEQIEPGTAVYTVPLVLRLRGRLAVPALRLALNQLLARHEALRTTFPAPGGRPRQEVSAAVDLELPLTCLSAGQDPAELIAAEAARPFDLERGPLVRARLLRTAPDDHRLLLAFHHIVIDAWSLDILFRELSELYGAAVAGTRPRLPDVYLQYPDYASWQREWLQGEALDGLLAHWRAALGGAPMLDLPADGPHRARIGFGGTVTAARVEPGTARELRAFSRRHGVTLYMTLLAGFTRLLAGWTGQDDVTVGTPVAGRIRPELRDVVGCLINMVPLRVDLSGEPAFPELVARVRRSALGAFAHQELPFDRLVEGLGARRGADFMPFFRVMFSFLTRREAPRLTGLDHCEAELGWPPNAAQFALSLIVEEQGEELKLTLQYDTDLFRQDTAARLLEEYRRILGRLNACET